MPEPHGEGIRGIFIREDFVKSGALTESIDNRYPVNGVADLKQRSDMFQVCNHGGAVLQQFSGNGGYRYVAR
jgi:hypothetical protein